MKKSNEYLKIPRNNKDKVYWTNRSAQNIIANIAKKEWMEECHCINSRLQLIIIKLF